MNKNLIIITTPMCEKILEFAGIKEYKVNKHPDEEEGDLAILLSESKVKMNSLAIKLNTFSQIKESIVMVSKYNVVYDNENKQYADDKKGGENRYQDDYNISENEIYGIFSEYDLANDWLNMSKKEEFRRKNSEVKVKVFSEFLHDIVEDMGFDIVEEDLKEENFEYIIFPDYMDIQKEYHGKYNLISIPTHGNVDKDPIKRAELRYSILNDIV